VCIQFGVHDSNGRSPIQAQVPSADDENSMVDTYVCTYINKT